MTKKRMEAVQCNFVSDLASSLPGQFELETEKIPGNGVSALIA